MDLTHDLLALDWPESFYVHYRDGHRELLLLGEGIGIIPPLDDPEGVGGFDAMIPKKQPKHQHQGGRYIRFTELDKIVNIDGTILYSSPNNGTINLP